MANEDKRIIELPASESILNDDWIGKDSASEGTTKMQLSLLKQLFGGNNFAGEWHSGTVYNKDAYVTHEGKLYHNIKGGSVVAVDWTSSQWTQVSISNELRKIVESLAPTFDTSTNYSVDDLVIYDNTLYRCIVAHTAGTWISSHFTAVTTTGLINDVVIQLNNAKEQIYTNIYANIAPTFSSSTSYAVGDYVRYGNQLYMCETPHNGNWNANDFRALSVSTALTEIVTDFATKFSPTTNYSVGHFCVHNNKLYRCNTPHTGAWNWEHFSLTNVSDLVGRILFDIALPFSTTTNYVVGDYVTYNTYLYKCTTAHSAGTWNASHFTSVKVMDVIKEKVADIQIAGQTTVDENHISDLTSLAIEGTASGEIASFSDGSNLPMRSFICNIDAVQDLHGYDGPWVGGAGKNKFPILIGDDVWIGNQGATYTSSNGVLIIESLAPTNTSSGVYSSSNSKMRELVATLDGEYVYSFEIKCNKEARITCGISNHGNIARTVSTNWVRYEIPTTFSIGENVGCVFYNYSKTENLEIQVRNFMIQQGTTATPYEPYENICPISGHTGIDAWVRGVNLCDEDFEAGGVKNNDGQNTSSTTRIRTKNYIRICPNTSYYGYYGDSTIKMYAFYYDENKTYIGTQGILIKNKEFTTPSNAYYMRISTYTDASPEPDTYDGVYHNNISINYPSTDMEYHAYNPNSQTIQVSWQTEAGEVYGGYVDLVSGELTVDRVGVTYSDADRKRNDGSFRLYPLPSNALVTNMDNEQPSPLFICDKFKFMSIFEIITTTAVNVGIGISKTSQGFYIKDTAMLQMTLEEAQTYLSSHPIDVVYPLATPITYQLTPTQIKSLKDDITNAWASTGNVNVKYNKDATIVINSLIARIEALENA